MKDIIIVIGLLISIVSLFTDGKNNDNIVVAIIALIMVIAGGFL
jgi:hypothetical protein